MAITREEAVIQIGVDATQVASGLSGAQKYIEHFGDKMVGKFNKLLGVSVWHEAINLIAHGIDELTKHWLDLYYNVDAASSAAFANLAKHWHELRGNADKAREAAEKGLAAYRMSNLTDEGKKNLFNEEIAANEKKLNWAKEILKITTEDLAISKNANLTNEQRADFLEKQVQAQTAVNSLEAEKFKLAVQLDAVQDRMNDKAAQAIKDEEQARKKKEQEEQETARKAREERAHNLEYRQRLAGIISSEQEAFMPTLKQLAESGRFWGSPGSTSGFGFTAGPFAGIAQNIQALGERATQQFIYGNVAGAQASIQERNRRYDALFQAGIVPMRQEAIAEAQLAQAEDIRAIRRGDATVRTALELVNP